MTLNPVYYGSTLSGYTGGSGVSQYWYGPDFFSNQNHRANFVQNPMTRSTSFDQYGGWKVGSSLSAAIPGRPVIFARDTPSQTADHAQNKLRLTAYLNSRAVNYANTLFSQYSKVEFVSGGTQNGQQVGSLKLYIPVQNAYQSSLVNIRFPTERANTIVDRPAIGDFKLTVAWESTGTDHAQASTTQKLDVTVKNTGSVQATGDLKLTCSNAKVGIYPLSGSITLAAGASQTAVFTVTNLGVATQETDIPITITVSDAYTAEVKDTKTAYITLLPTLVQGTTYLTVHCVEKTNGTTASPAPIPGLSVQALYPSNQPTENKEGYTGTDGTIEFNLDIGGSGGYTGEVIIQSAENSDYKSAQTTTTVQEGVNEVTLHVEKKGDVYTGGWDWLIIALIVIIVIVIVSVIAAAIYVKKKKSSRRRK
jgi:hypothetical protein